MALKENIRALNSTNELHRHASAHVETKQHILIKIIFWLGRANYLKYIYMYFFIDSVDKNKNR